MIRLLSVVFALTACTAPKHADPARVDSEVRYRGQTVDIAPFVVGDPWSVVLPLWDRGELLLDHQGTGRLLNRVSADLDGAPPELADARPLVDIDWDTRTRWNLQAHGDQLYWVGDPDNTERLNLWTLPIEGGEPRALTDEPYLYGYSIHEPTGHAAIIARRGDGPYQSCVALLDLASGGRTQVICDTPSAALTWSEPVWSPDGQRLLVRVNLNGQRSRANIAAIDLDAPSLRLLLDPAPVRRQAAVLSPWVDADTAIVQVDDHAHQTLDRLTISTGARRTVHTATDELRASDLFQTDGGLVLLATEHDPVRDVLFLVDPATGTPIDRVQVQGKTSWVDSDDRSRALLTVTSGAAPTSTLRVDVTAEHVTVRPWLQPEPELLEQLVRCDVERVQVPTFDTDPDTGERRLLHAFLYTPKAGPPRADQLVRVTAFYGGDNRFDDETQLHCAAGIATLSPAVRGSSGFGSAFAALNDGDLGGDEIVDLFEAARWLVEQGFSGGRIGVYGGSHGGYATLRALTFPPGTNDHGAERLFPFAFGVARAPFSDIVTFHDTCNIPDWVLLEAGDPKVDAARLHDRSPLQHVDKLKAPLLMVHGENDSRVPVHESRQMAQACERVGAPCTYVEFPGMGHSIKGVQNLVRRYQATLSMLEGVGG